VATEPLNEAAMRRLYVDLQPGDRVEVTHHVKIGFREHVCRTKGTVVSKDRRECGIDSGFRRARDDKYWFDHLLLKKDDGELTTVTMDEFTEMRRITTD
jgi:hypothetical protein